jgi:hypothetical protein
MTSQPQDHSELSELLGKLCNEALDAPGKQRLNDKLVGDLEAQKQYILYSDLHANLRHFAQSFDDEEFVLREAQAAIDSMVQSAQADGASLASPDSGAKVDAKLTGQETCLASPRNGRWGVIESWKRRPVLGWALTAMVLIASAIGIQFYSGFAEKPQENLAGLMPDQARSSTEDAQLSTEELGPAHLSGAVGARWAGKKLEMIEGTQFRAGQRLELVEGLAEVCFLSGARVILQGPAILRIEDENTASVPVGRVAATIPESASRFTLHTAIAAITSKGAEYGVEVDVDESLLTQAYSGIVELRLSDSDSPDSHMELAENQGLQINAATGRVKQLDEANRLHFVRYLPQHDVLINLADIVAGGNGLRTRADEGYHRGVSVPDGKLVGAYGAPTLGDGKYHLSQDSDFVDGVFIPNGKRGAVQVDSIGRTFAGFPPTTDECWGGVIMARRPKLEKSLPFMQLEFHGNNYGYVNWLHVASRPEELSPLGYGLIGMHSNCGITFDLHAIRAHYPNKQIVRFRALVGNLEAKQEAVVDNPKAGEEAVEENLEAKREVYAADAWVLVDGKLRYSRKAFSREQGVEEIEVPLADRDRFLVLAVTDSGKDTAYDWVAFGDPVIETVAGMDRVAFRAAEPDSMLVVALESRVASNLLGAMSRVFLSTMVSPVWDGRVSYLQLVNILGTLFNGELSSETRECSSRFVQGFADRHPLAHPSKVAFIQAMFLAIQRVTQMKGVG